MSDITTQKESKGLLATLGEKFGAVMVLIALSSREAGMSERLSAEEQEAVKEQALNTLFGPNPGQD